MSLASEVQKKVQMFVKGNVSQAMTGQLVAEDLVTTKTAEIARAI